MTTIDINAPLRDLEDTELAYQRLLPFADALTEAEFSSHNVEIVGATSIILGAAPRVLAFRERAAKLPEFDVTTSFDRLVDAAKAAWFVYNTQLPEGEPPDFQQQFDECVALRTQLLTWAIPLVHAKFFEQAAIDQIKAGSGNKDIPSDVVALVTLYRSKWDTIKTVCGVTEAELARGAAIAPGVFAVISRRENKLLPSQSDGTQRIRRFWTLADRAYEQCQRAIGFLEFGKTEVSSIAPSVRRNVGTKGLTFTVTPATDPAAPTPGADPPAAPAPAPAVVATAAPTGVAVGNGSNPFAR